MFVIFSGVSGAGKQTIMDAVMEDYANSEVVKSATTREKREGEDIHYYMTHKEFQAGIKKEEFFEYENVHGFMYGILNKDLKHVIDHPEIMFFKDVDVHGTEKLVKYLKGKTKVVTIFLDCPDEILHDRLLKRGESEERVKVRLQRGAMERPYKDKYDFAIDNIVLDETIAKVKEFILKAQN